MSYNNQEIEKMLKTMQLVTQGMNIKDLASLYSLEPDAPEKEYPVKLEHLNFMRKHISGGSLRSLKRMQKHFSRKIQMFFKDLKLSLLTLMIKIILMREKKS